MAYGDTFTNQQFVGGSTLNRKRVMDALIAAINRERGSHSAEEAQLLAEEKNRQLLEADAEQRAKMTEQAGMTNAATTVGSTGLMLYGKDMKDWAGNLFKADTSPTQGAMQNIGGTPTKAYQAVNAGEAISPGTSGVVQGVIEPLNPATKAVVPNITTPTSSVPTSATNLSPTNFMAGNAPMEVSPGAELVVGETAKGAVSSAQAATGGFTEGLSLGGSVIGPAAAGTAAPGLVNMIRPTATENVGRIATLGLTKDEDVKKGVGGAVVGGTAGAITGGFASGAAATSWSGPGAIVGGVVGALGGAISSLLNKDNKGPCIIVTACTDRDSYEVNVARQYRDSFLNATQLRGYYVIAEKLVPEIENDKFIKHMIKKYLVDNLIDYGKYKLGLSKKTKITSCIVSKLFLGIIYITGIIVPRFKRSNGEVY